MLARLEALARRLDTPMAHALAAGAAGIIAHFEGRFRASIEPLERAEQLFVDRCAGVSWERSTAQIFHLYSLSVLGRVRELSARLEQLLGEAQARGDLHAQTNLAITIGFQAHLAADRPDEARRSVGEALARWNAPDESHIQHFNAMVATVCIDLYADENESAWRRLEALGRFERVGTLSVQTARINALWAHSGAALATAVRHRERLAAAERNAARLAREGVPYAAAIAALVRASIAHLRGADDAEVDRRLRQAEAGFAESGLDGQVAAVRWARGRRLGGDAGAQLAARAAAWFSAEGVRNHDRFAAFFVRGLLE